MILSLCFLLLALSPSRQEICSAPGALRAPILYLSQSSARPGVSVWLQCSVFSQAPATRVIFCKDGEEVSSQKGSEKVAYNYVQAVSGGSSGNYSCGYEIKDGNNRVTRSQLSPARHLNVTGSASSSRVAEEPTHKVPSPSSQDICSAPGALPAPTLYLSQKSAGPGDSVWLQCALISQATVTHIIFCKDGEEVSSQMGSKMKVTYTWDHAASRDSSGNYSCRYDIEDSDNRVTRSQLSPAQRLSITGIASSSRGAEEPIRTGPDMSPVVWAVRCALVLLLLVSAPVITFLLEKRGLPEPAGLEETRGGSSSILERRAAGSGGTPLKSHGQGGDTSDQL